jgi:ABC transport system ATP-binding/permease protein
VLSRRPVDDLFQGKQQVSLGRSGQSGQMHLDHPGVALIHAILRRESGRRITVLPADPYSPVLINGRQIDRLEELSEGERLGIGPYLIWHQSGTLFCLDNSDGIDLEVSGLTCKIGNITLLDHVSFSARRGEFVGVLGTSGSGKSTLIKCLLRRMPIVCGEVRANGERFFDEFATFRPLIGYVPQNDIVHQELSVRDTLRYAAKLRNPCADNELATRIDETLAKVQLVLDGSLAATLSKKLHNLSGGQKRRVSLASEILSSPKLLLADEATSGLDPGTDREIMKLFRELADAGTAVVCVTHNVEHLDQCTKIIILHKSRCLFEGTPTDALNAFGASKFADVYLKVDSGHLPSPTVTSSSPAATPSSSAGTQVTPPFAFVGRHKRRRSLPGYKRAIASATDAICQYSLLTRRYAALTISARTALAVSLALPALLGMILVLGFRTTDFSQTVLATRRATSEEKLAATSLEGVIGGSTFSDQLRVYLRQLREGRAVVPDREIVSPIPTYQILYIISIAVLWFACANAAKEVVKEHAVYEHERLTTLKIWPYLASKVTILWVLALLQVGLFLGAFYGLFAFFGTALPEEYSLPWREQIAVLALMSIAGIAFGLLISCWATSQEQATATSTYFLVAQLLLGGGVVELAGTILAPIAWAVSPPYWAYRAMARGMTTLPEDFPSRRLYEGDVLINCLPLAMQALLALIVAGLFLAMRERGHWELISRVTSLLKFPS